MALLSAASVHAGVDRKCYVELENGIYVVIQGTITDSQRAESPLKRKDGNGWAAFNGQKGSGVPANRTAIQPGGSQRAGGVTAEIMSRGR